MLPNHAPLVVAEATSARLPAYPSRIDLGLGRAPGTDGETMRALRRERIESEADFPRDVAGLPRAPARPAPTGTTPRRRPRRRLSATCHSRLLGSSLFSARLAAERGLPYAFASHFAPAMLLDAITLYRRNFRPSSQLDKPYVIIGVPLVAAATDDEAEFLASSVFQRVLGIVTGQRGKLPPPVAGFMANLRPR